MLIKREMEPKLRSLAGQFPVITIYGPRQSGKTTLVKEVFKDFDYVNLEKPDDFRAASEDPEGFLKRHPAPLIIDEVQKIPALLSWIMVKVDETHNPGQYVLTGSHQPLLSAGVSQSLAGRTAIVTLYPLSCRELSASFGRLSKEEAIARGFLPRIWGDGCEAGAVLESYFQTYVERDVRQLVQLEKFASFERFVRLLAGRVGQVVNLSSLSRDTGVDVKTIDSWLSILEASYIVQRLQPYYSNFGKRFIKAPKIYFTDVGLAAWLLGIRSPEQAIRDPLFGGLMENLAVMEAMKWKCNSQENVGLYYMRSQKGLEADLVIERARRLHLIEIKGAETPDQSAAKNLSALSGIVGGALSKSVIYAGKPFPLIGGGDFINYQFLADHLDRLMQIEPY